MRQFYENANFDIACESDSAMSLVDYSIFSPEVVGECYKKRLNEIWARRNVTRGAKKIDLAFESSDKSI
jgi:hypothetical protein